MIKIDKRLGSMLISQEYFTSLIGTVASGCYGVAGMVNSSPAQGIKALIFGNELIDKGVFVKQLGGELFIDLHIKVVYGMNISAIVASISNKVRYAVEEATGLTVNSVNVSVDAMTAE